MVDLLIGSDVYWNLVTGSVQQGKNEAVPLAEHIRVGWVLSRPDKLEDTLRRFWDLKSLGIMPDEASVYAQGPFTWTP